MNTRTTLHLTAALALAIFQTIRPAAHAAQFTNGQAADRVLGQPNFVSSGTGSGANQMNHPDGVAIDPATGKVFVADNFNGRVLRFSSVAAMTSGAAAEAVLGQAGFGSVVLAVSQSRMSAVHGLCVDSTGRLWVAGNERVLRFENAASKPSGAPADGVLGQTVFTTQTFGSGSAGMTSPTSVAVDSAGTLWVADFSNNRVLRFDNAGFKNNGDPADGVLGQPDFTTTTASLSASGMDHPVRVATDSAGRLWVCELGNRRVLRFDNAAAIGSGANADGVLGQPSFVASGFGTSGTTMGSPQGVVVGPDGTLFVADTSNDRILLFSDAANKGLGAAADFVLGQPDFGSGGAGTSATQFDTPRGLATDAAGRLFVTERENNRVMRFSPNFARPKITLLGPRTRVTTQPSIVLRGTASSEAGLAKVQFKVNNGAFKNAIGTTSWRLKALLKPGANKITIRAVGEDGKSSPLLVVTVTRN